MNYIDTETKWNIEVELPLYGYGNILSGFKVTPKYLLTLTDQVRLQLYVYDLEFVTLDNYVYCSWYV